MVRTTIACARCRKAKIKCLHDGTPPCRNCLKSRRTLLGECILTGPVLQNVASRHNHPRSGSQIRPVNQSPGPNGAKAALQFARQFPELGFLHLPSIAPIFKRLDETFQLPADGSHVLQVEACEISINVQLLYCAIVAACSVPIDGQHCADTYAHIACQNISFTDAPDIHTVQTLLVISIYEWGRGNGYKAWMYTGVAIRMMQSLIVVTKMFELSELQYDIHCRTEWSCFIMDRLVFSGKSQPHMLSADSMKFGLPTGEQDFAFASAFTKKADNPQPKIQDSQSYYDLDSFFSLLVRGYEVWARIFKWIIDGGRRQSGMSRVQNCPWMEGSPWRILYNDLQAWRGVQGSRIRFPETDIDIHVSMGKGEQYAYINLLYYISVLFLGREYIPFLPRPDTKPQGPIDPPLLESVAPEGWWAERSQELFEASSSIAKILQRLDELGAQFHSPFIGFCSFSATTMNIYVSCWPGMNMRKSVGSSGDVEIGLEYLKAFKSAWPIGQRWWVTIQQTKSLYERASRDAVAFRGRTREHYQTLEMSIHDPTGTSPADGNDMAEQSLNVERAAQESEESSIPLDEPTPGYREDEQGSLTATGLLYDYDANQWAQVWPLWGEQQYFPYMTESITDETGINDL